MKKGSSLAGLGLIGACALCCTLPLFGGLAALGVSSFFLNPFILTAVALIFVAAGYMVYQKRKANGSPCVTKGCNCNSCTTKEA